MNFHTDEWIMEKVREHYEEAVKIIGENRIVGVFYQGSGNYGLDYENSDVDTKCVVLPTIDELANGSKPISHTHIRDNDEHIDFKDIRLMLDVFKKRNLNYVEIMFTKYKVVNPLYERMWNKIAECGDLLTYGAKDQVIRSLFGIASEKYHALEHPYPSRMEWINKFGYDPKQLHHLLRLRQLLDRFVTGNETFQQCLQANQADYLILVKKGCYDLRKARELAEEAMSYITQTRNDFTCREEIGAISLCNTLMDEQKVELIKRGVVMSLLIGETDGKK